MPIRVFCSRSLNERACGLWICLCIERSRYGRINICRCIKTYNMDKSQTIILKGVAILMMLYLHLFDTLSVVDTLCENYIHIGNLPLSYILSRCAHPVVMYVILGGYGLYRKYSLDISNYSILSSIRRVARLYIHYWVVLFISLPIASLLHPLKYPGSLLDFVLNGIGISHSYNLTMWFLFPYALLIICSKFVFRFVDRMPSLSVLMFGSLYLISYYLCWEYGEFLRGKVCLYNVVLMLNFLLPFIIGVIFAKYHIIDNIKRAFDGKSVILIILLLPVIVLRACTDFDLVNILYAPILVLLLAVIEFPKGLKTLLGTLGKRSTSMWFVHAYFCYYLFRDFIYGFRYPLIIFVVLVAVSYMVSIVVDYINQRVQRTIFA